MTVAELKVKLGITGERDVQRGLERVREGAARTAGALRMLSSALSPLSRLAGVAASVTGLATAFNAFNEAVSRDSLIRGLATVSTNVDGLMSRLKAARDIAKLPGLGLSEAIQAQLQLETAGLDQRLAQRLIKGSGNMVAGGGGSKEDFQEVVRQISQIVAAGRLTEENLGVIRERAPAVGAALQAAFGTSSAEAIRGMGLSIDEFTRRFVAGIETLPKVSGGIQNTIDNLKDLAVEAILPLGKGIIALLQSLEQFAERGLAAVQKRMEAIGQVLAALGESGVVADALSRLFDGIQKISGSNGLADFSTRMIAGLLAFTAEIPTVIQYIGDVFANLGQNIEVVFLRARRFIFETQLAITTLLEQGKAAMMFLDPQARISGDYGRQVAKVQGLQSIQAMMRYVPQAGFVQQSPVDPRLAIATRYNAYTQAIQSNIRPLSEIPSGLTYGTAPKAAAAQAKQEGLLERIARSNEKIADATSLRRQALGGGELGKLGVSASELGPGASTGRILEAAWNQKQRRLAAATNGFRPR